MPFDFRNRSNSGNSELPGVFGAGGYGQATGNSTEPSAGAGGGAGIGLTRGRSPTVSAAIGSFICHELSFCGLDSSFAKLSRSLANNS
jgi:hypothetical protein